MVDVLPVNLQNVSSADKPVAYSIHKPVLSL